MSGTASPDLQVGEPRRETSSDAGDDTNSRRIAVFDADFSTTIDQPRDDAAQDTSRSSTEVPPSSSGEMELLRRLTRLNARVFSGLQTRIMAMEATLDDLDSHAEAGKGEDGGNKEIATTRNDVVDALIPKLREYSMFRTDSYFNWAALTATDEFIAACVAAGELTNSTQTNTYGVQRQPGRYELAFLKHGQRDISPESHCRGGDGTKFTDSGDSPVDELMLRLTSSLQNSWQASQSTSAAVRAFLCDPYVREIAGLVAAFAVGLGILLIPVWWLEAVDDGVKRLGTIIGIVLLVAAVLQRGTKPKVYEVLGATTT